jgi:hypothetical protein
LGAPRSLVAFLSKNQKVKTGGYDREQQDQNHQNDLCSRIAVGFHYVGQSKNIKNDGCNSEKRTHKYQFSFYYGIALGYESENPKVRQYVDRVGCDALRPSVLREMVY